MADTDLPPPDSLPQRVLVVGANYWPEDSGSAPYTTGFAEDLAVHGASVTALVGMPHYPQWRVRPGYAGRLRVRESHGGVHVVHSWLWVPPRQSAFQRALWEASFLASTLTVRGIERPQVIVASTPSLSSAVAARLLARRWRVPYGVIVQDLVGPGATQSGISGGAGVSALVRRMERWALIHARRVAIVSPGFAPYLAELGIAAERTVRVRNWSTAVASAAAPEEVRARLGLPSDRHIAVHAGAMGLKQGLAQVIDAARLDQQRESAWCFVLAGDGSQRASIEARAEGLRNVRFLPQQSTELYMDLLTAADVLLVSERSSMQNMSLPGKLTSYAVADRPVVAAVPPDGVTAKEIERSGLGVVTPAGDPSALLAAMDAIAADTGLARALARAGVAFAASELDRRAALAGLRAFVSSLVGPGDQA